MTAPENEWEMGASHRQEWLGFEQAPRTSSIYGQMPISGQRTSLGGFFMLDKIQPIRTNLFALTYAYKVGPRPRRRTRRRGQLTRQSWQLSLGLMASASHVLVNPFELTVNQGNDPLLPSGEQDKFQPNVGAGLYFVSAPGGRERQSYFFVGAGANQILNNRLAFREESPTFGLQRAFHGNGTLGYHYGSSELHVEPSLWVSVAGSNIIDAQFNVILEKPSAFWAGLNFNRGQTLGVQMGVDAGGEQYGGNLRIGALGTINVGDFGPARGLGFEIYLAYRGAQ